MQRRSLFFALWPAIAVCLANALEIPFQLRTRVADRCITLHWQSSTQGEKFHVFRATDPEKSFFELPNSPLTIQSVADLNVENGRTYFYRLTQGSSTNAAEVSARSRPFASDDDFLDFLEGAAFDYFWYEADAANGLVRDRSVLTSPSSMAAVGFGLTALGVGVDRGWITRREGAQRASLILRTLAQAPQDAGPEAAGYKGWFYHFLDTKTLQPYRRCELSSIDTALLMAGVLYASEFFNQAEEREIQELARKLFSRLDWTWMLDGEETLRMGWRPETGFIKARWKGYNEAGILYLLGLGTDGSSGLQRRSWEAWTKSYAWRTSYGLSFIHFAPLFGHQYTHCWVDFRAMQDDYTRARAVTYFENSRRATLAQRAYAIDNPRHFAGYGTNVWGFTACDGPAARGITGYAARGAPPAENDDGTIAPTAVGASIPFAPIECIAALRHLYEEYRARLVCGYGFRDAFHLGLDWWDPDTLGIDQGPILIMIENYRTGKVWEVMKRCRVLERGLAQAGFRSLEQESQ